MEHLELEEDTLVFCTSDNGGVNAFSNAGLRGKKSNVWEGGHRVPGIFRWPGKIEAGTVSDETIGFVDLLPTFCDLAGVDLPKRRKLDGLSIRKHLTDGKAINRKDPLFWFFYRVNPSMAFRQGDWVLISNTTDSMRPKTHSISKEDLPIIKSAELSDFQLFNLKEDLGQTTDVLEQNKKQFEKMKKQMIKVHREIVTEGEHWDLPVQNAPKKPIGT